MSSPYPSSSKSHVHFSTLSLAGTRSSTDTRRRVDEATRKRRQQQQLAALEKDNFHDDPHAAFAHIKTTKLPTFSDSTEGVMCVLVYLLSMQFIGKRKRKSRSNADHFKQVNYYYYYCETHHVRCRVEIN